MKPFSESCVQNRDPILEILRKELADHRRVLEIASGTGQHAVYFAAALPHLIWQTSDLLEHHPGIQAWLDEARLPNVLAPIDLDVNAPIWPIEVDNDEPSSLTQSLSATPKPGAKTFDAIFNANTVHIIDWPAVGNMFAGIGRILEPGGRLCMYGPFNYCGQFTSDSNARFDAWLKTRDPASGIRDFEALDQLAQAQGLRLLQDYAMPANNRTLVWQRER